MAFVAARWFDRGPREVRRIILHDGEVPESKTAAEGIAAFFHGGSRKGSAHYECDCDSTVQSVADADVAWHAAGDNQKTIGIEQAGYAAQTRDQWLDQYGTQMIVYQVSPLVARKGLEFGIPMRLLTDDQLRRDEKGIATHAQVSRVFHASAHWDPGPNYPLDVLLRHALEWTALFQRNAVNAPAPIIPKNDALAAIALLIAGIRHTALKEGDRNREQEIRFVQKLLRRKGATGLPLDGAFGPTDKAVVQFFQGSRGLPTTGIVDSKTLDALLK